MKQRLHAVLLSLIVAVVLYATITRAGNPPDECNQEWGQAIGITASESLTFRDTP